jgi:hypothetical protein
VQLNSQAAAQVLLPSSQAHWEARSPVATKGPAGRAAAAGPFAAATMAATAWTSQNLGSGMAGNGGSGMAGNGPGRTQRAV